VSTSELINHNITRDREVIPLHCDCCGTAGAFRSRRTHFIEFLRTRFTGKVPFRCAHCKRRFWFHIDPRDL
jgi:hypothetical protein